MLVSHVEKLIEHQHPAEGWVNLRSHPERVLESDYVDDPDKAGALKLAALLLRADTQWEIIASAIPQSVVGGVWCLGYECITTTWDTFPLSESANLKCEQLMREMAFHLEIYPETEADHLHMGNVVVHGHRIQSTYPDDEDEGPFIGLYTKLCVFAHTREEAVRKRNLLWDGLYRAFEAVHREVKYAS